MKNILVDANMLVTQIADKPFEVHSELRWVEVSDETEVKTGDMVNADDSIVNIEKAWLASNIGQRIEMIAARIQAYGDVGAQLDEIYKDQVDGTTKWKDRIAKIKTDIPKVAPVINADGIEV